MKLWLTRDGNVLHPADTESLVQFAKIPFDKALQAEMKQPRNPRYHRWFFKICSRISEGVGSDAETIANVFKHATGHVTIVKTKSYGDVMFPKSISFAKMDDIKFHEFVERCIACAYTEWGIPPESLADLLAPQESQKR